MSIDQSFRAGHGASPRTVADHGLTLGEAQALIAGVEKARQIMRKAAQEAGVELSSVGAWFEPANAAKRLEDSVLDDLDQLLHQTKLEEAGELGA